MRLPTSLSTSRPQMKAAAFRFECEPSAARISRLFATFSSSDSPKRTKSSIVIATCGFGAAVPIIGRNASAVAPALRSFVNCLRRMRVIRSFPRQVAQVGQNSFGQVDALFAGYGFLIAIDRKKIDIAFGFQITHEPSDIFAIA